MKKWELFFKGSLMAFAGTLFLSGCGESKEGISGAKQQELSAYAQPPAVTVDICRGEKYAEDGTLLVSGDYEILILNNSEANETYGALQNTLKEWALEQEKLFGQTMEQYCADAQEHLAMVGTEQFTAYSTNTELECMRVDAFVVSIRERYWDYAGGAHGNYGYQGVTFDAISGKRLALADLMVDEAAMEQFCAAAADCCVKNVEEQGPEGLSDGYEEGIREKFIAGQVTDNWYLDAKGITIVCNPYEIGSYAMGEIFVTFPYEEAEQFLKPQYRSFSGAGVVMLETEAQVWLPLSGQEQKVPVALTLTQHGKDGTPPSLTITAGSLTAEIEMLEYVGRAYAVRDINARMFLLFDMDMASDDDVTMMYELTPEGIHKTAEEAGSIDRCSVNVDSLKLIQRIDVLGTYSTEAEYRIETDGTLTLLTDWYEIACDTYGSILTTVREISVVADGKKVFLPAGSRLQLLGTDNKGIVTFRELDSSVEGEIHFTRDDADSPIYIDGAAEDEYFENLPYTG